jgi:hypothetical protein
MRLLMRYDLLFDPRTVCNYRILANSLSRNPDRHGDFLLSEARMIAKYAAESKELDALIAARILVTCEKLLEMRDAPRLEQVLKLAATVSRDSSIQSAQSALARNNVTWLAKNWTNFRFI